MEPSGIYYANVQRKGKLIRHSLKTDDRKIAERKFKIFMEKLGRLQSGMVKATFDEMLEQWRKTELAVKDLKPRGREYREQCVAGLLKTWPGLKASPVQQITRAQCEAWFAKRMKQISATHANNELDSLKMVLRFAVREGCILDSPAEDIKRLKVPKVQIIIPTRPQFAALVNRLKERGNWEAANFVELLGYSGMRRNELASLQWGDIDFQRGTFTVTGGEQGTKNREIRTVPLFPPMRRALEQIKAERGQVAPTDTVVKILECRELIGKACREINTAHVTHHSMRHFFTSNGIEEGIDFKVIAAWLGHKDGGVLVAKTYGHLRQQHSEAMAAKMTFDATVEPVNVVAFQKQATG